MSFCRILSTLCSHVVFHNLPHSFAGGKRAGQKVHRKIALAHALCTRCAYSSGTDVYAEHSRQELLYTLSPCISSLRACSVLRFFKCSFCIPIRMRVWNLWVHWAYASGSDAHPDHTQQELISVLAYASETGACTEHTSGTNANT